MSKVNYRQLARQSLERAQSLLAEDDDDVLRYAALELRLCMEALTYDRAQAYKKEIPPEEWGKWQPRQVMKLLLEIDPDADRNYSLHVGEEPYPGGQPERMHAMGAETVFGLSDLKQSYDAVGSILHMPTMLQMEAGKNHSTEKMRARCNDSAAALAKALSSPIWNFTVGEFASCDCAECGARVRRRMPREFYQLRAKCFHCKAEYDVILQENREVTFKPRVCDLSCPTVGCEARFVLWEHQVRAGARWQCKKCEKPYGIMLGIAPVTD
ncbi:hypothetical protein QFW77_14570 [Luteimonas sp. RD2P54]|uniref:Uncharacterized protein n=1 Tax=Luteimonas endophytica TaxID=3042023 RepID=A0ABT6JBK1_9GAMM|nr:hypothetical protein [Luteimonas endophytica]MDH5824202.1 hypothetical protein [Luteimonas endophytica]